MEKMESQALIEELDRDVPRLTLVLPPDAATDHLALQLDGGPEAIFQIERPTEGEWSRDRHDREIHRERFRPSHALGERRHG